MRRLTDKRKKRGPDTEPLVAVSLLESEQGEGALVPGSTPNAEAWRSGRTLRVGEQLFQVVVNPPSVLKARTEQYSFPGMDDMLIWCRPHSLSDDWCHRHSKCLTLHSTGTCGFVS